MIGAFGSPQQPCRILEALMLCSCHESEPRLSGRPSGDPPPAIESRKARVSASEVEATVGTTTSIVVQLESEHLASSTPAAGQ